MALYLISFEADDEHDYSKLVAEFEESDVLYVQEGRYVANLGNETASEVHDWVSEMLDEGDSLFVVKLGSNVDWASSYLDDDDEDDTTEVLTAYLAP